MLTVVLQHVWYEDEDAWAAGHTWDDLMKMHTSHMSSAMAVVDHLIGVHEHTLCTSGVYSTPESLMHSDLIVLACSAVHQSLMPFEFVAV